MQRFEEIQQRIADIEHRFDGRPAPRNTARLDSHYADLNIRYPNGSGACGRIHPSAASDTRTSLGQDELARMKRRADFSSGGETPRSSRITVTTLAISVAAIIGFSGCETPGQTALAGAAAGAAIGGALHGRGEDALRGAAIGAGAGYVAGRVARNQRERAYREGYYDARYDDRYNGRRYYRDRHGDRYFIGRDGRRYYVD